MLGHRGIYHQGWQANTVPPAGPWEADDLPAPEDYEWELYHLDEDYSQARNLPGGPPSGRGSCRPRGRREPDATRCRRRATPTNHAAFRPGSPAPKPVARRSPPGG